MSNRLGGLQGTAYLGTNANQPPNCVFQANDPTSFDINYSLLDIWLNTSNKNIWILTSLKGNNTSKGQVAFWTLLATGSGDVSTLTGNTGGPVVPTGANINILGVGNIVVSGSGSTLTITDNNNIVFNYTAVSSSPYVVQPTDYYLGVNTTSIPITIEFPNGPTQYRTFVVKDVLGNARTNNITLTTVGGTVLIDGATSFVMNTAYEATNLLFDGTQYQIY